MTNPAKLQNCFKKKHNHKYHIPEYKDQLEHRKHPEILYRQHIILIHCILKKSIVKFKLMLNF